MKSLKSRTAIVTGASRGIGPHIAEALAAQAMNLVLVARSRQALQRTAARVRLAGGVPLVVPADLTARESLPDVAEAANREFGAIDVLVNNAGATLHCPYHRMGIADIMRGLEVNLISAMILTRLVLPGMLARRRGHIVNLASLAGKLGPPCDEVYGATKAGLIGFTQSLRMSYRVAGVSASVICPGFVLETGMYEDVREKTGHTAPAWVGRASPGAVARAVLRAILRDLPEIIVNRPPARPLTALAEVSPSLSEWLMRRFGAFRTFRANAEANVAADGRLTGLTDSPVDPL
jgi:short-subunit dehydrogenase